MARPRARSDADAQPTAELGARRSSRLATLGPDWLPIALLAGDAIIVVASTVGAYLFHRSIDPFHTEGRFLPFGPYAAAIPVVVLLYLFALTINHQYQSWRGRSLSDLLLGQYSGIGLAAVLVLAAIS